MEDNAIYVYEVFSLEFLICWRRAWYVLRLRKWLSTSLADVLRQCAQLNLGYKTGFVDVEAFHPEKINGVISVNCIFYKWPTVCLMKQQWTEIDSFLIMNSSFKVIELPPDHLISHCTWLSHTTLWNCATNGAVFLIVKRKWESKFFIFLSEWNWIIDFLLNL